MLSLRNYIIPRVDAPLYESGKSLVCRGRRSSDELPVILKVLKGSHPPTDKIAWFRREFETSRGLSEERAGDPPVAGVARALSLECDDGVWFMVFADAGGESLDRLELAGKLTISQFIDLAMSITDILGRVHRRQIIHKDLNLSNIVMNPVTKAVGIIDFGVSTSLSHEATTFCNPNLLEGTLAYVSPEQTGRMNRAVDYRTDYYSLGVTFYQLLTGRLPFLSSDPLELIHDHLARAPVPPTEIERAIPRPVSDIVLKLLSKNPEHRYQSARGLNADLEACRGAEPQAFELGRSDVSGRLHPPRELYGRQAEIGSLLAAFDRARAGQVELALVRGRGGIGKSVLVQELYRPITSQRGYFIAGKFDQLQRNVPYAALFQAIRSLILQLLTESSERLSDWRERLVLALAPNLRVVCDVIPELERIVGPQPDVPVLSPSETQNRLSRVFVRLFGVFARADHPLVVFLDDMQWADVASLSLLESLLAGSTTSHMLLLWAYRDNEVVAGHPLTMTLEQFEKVGLEPHVIDVGPLSLPDVVRWIGDATSSEPDRVRPLAELILAKTAGNPFFIAEFLATLHTERLLHLDYEQGTWQWDLTLIQAEDITDNVVELLTRKLDKLPAGTREVLQIASCIGNRFNLRTLSLAHERDSATTAAEIWTALTTELVHPLGDAYKIADQDVAEPRDQLDAEYRFAHDHVQRAVYSQIKDADKQRLHRRIGALLLAASTPAQRGPQLFDIVHHLNAGRSLIETSSDRDVLAQLNLEAGRKAKAAAANRVAYAYLEVGLELLGGDGWTRNYELALALHVEAADAGNLSGEFEAAGRLTATVLDRATSLLDTIAAHEVDMQSRLAQAQLVEAVHIGIDTLELLGVSAPKDPQFPDIMAAMQELAELVAARPVEELLELPEMSEAHALATIRVATTVTSIAFIAVNNLFPIMIAQRVGLSIRHGNTNDSITAYALYGLLLSAFGDVDTGYRFARLALDLWARRDAPEVESEVQLVGAFVRHHKEPLRDLLPTLRRAYQAGVDSGDLEMASNSAATYGQVLYLSGSDLTRVEHEMEIYCQAIAQLNQHTALHWHQIYWQGVLCLMGRSADPCRLVGEAYDEDVMVSVHESTRDRTAMLHLYTHKLMLCYRFGRHAEARRYADMLEGYIANASAMPVAPPVFFYDALTRLACLASLDSADQQQRDELLEKFAANKRKLEILAGHAPFNYLHKLRLVEAEQARVLGDHARAREFYDEAIELVRAQDCPNDESLAYELAARFFLAHGQVRLAGYYLRDAYYTYERWGAVAKLRDLESLYSHLLPPARGRAQATTGASEIRASGTLDLATALKASQAISGEIVLGTLLGKMMEIVIESAGAQRGFLIIQHKGQYRIEAEGLVTGAGGDAEVTVLQSIPLAETDALCAAVVNYVTRTNSNVVLNDASNEGMFIRDPYILRMQPKSVSCIPLVHQSKMTGALYLENNLTTHAFTAERLELLALISTQAAISIENSQLYTTQVALTQAYSRFVPPEYLEFLQKDSIVDVQLGDHVSREMAIMFSDIRSFTTLSENMTPKENFAFVNAYLERVSPIIREHGGFIVKYLGDGMMAVFPGGADDAIAAGVAKLRRITEYNIHRRQDGYQPIRIGIGIHSGHMMVGMVGEAARMQGDAFSDNVNLTARLEGLTKEFGVGLIVSKEALTAMKHPDRRQFRFLGEVHVKGKRNAISIFEILDAEPESMRAPKLQTKELFERGLEAFLAGRLGVAQACFDEVCQRNPEDRVAQLYRDRALSDLSGGAMVSR